MTMFKSKIVVGAFVVIFTQFSLLCCVDLNANDPGVCSKKYNETGTRTKVIPHKRCKGRPCIVQVKYQKTVKKSTCCLGWHYINANNSCSPLCKSGCVNGTCIAPEICQCKIPLVLKNHACVQLTCDPSCGLNSWCTANNSCSCYDGFVSINATHCAPKCLPGFINDPIECKPKCDNPCVNAACTAPNICVCKNGHRMINNFTCVPECNPTCENADCVAPNTCKCFNHFIPENQVKCIPKCDRCENGECIAPNSCKCHNEYSMKDGICAPVCDQSCANGMCSEPNTCKCDKGYTLDSANKFNCLPICEPKCLNASCVSPNTCSCLTGYDMTGNNWTCRPRCKNCENGECVAPKICKCYHGYSKVADKCEPICKKPCNNGFCSKPNVCSCNQGYNIDQMDKFNCQPICDNDCINSTCVAPDKCQCLYGYESTEKGHICKPKCSSCVHGECVAPDVCICNDGYNMTDDVCSPICSNPCVNGHCFAPETCSCKDGFKKNKTEPHVCYKECTGLCNHGECTLQGECICDRGFELENDICIEKKPVDCDGCQSNCTDGDCWCIDGRPCLLELASPDEVASSTSLAGLELSWMLGGSIGLLLLILLMGVILQMSRRKQYHENKATNNGTSFGSVVYTVPDTLMTSRPMYEPDVEEDSFYEEVPSRTRNDGEDGTNEHLLYHTHQPL